MKPSCYNRPPFRSTALVQDGWVRHVTWDGLIPNITRVAVMKEIPDPMSKTCQQHGPLGEATLHHGDWDCVGCKWKEGVEK